jgi:hypothetical protein
MKPDFRLLAFGAACVAQWAVPLASIYVREDAIQRGSVVRVAVSAPDPFDPLRGRYLQVRPLESEVVLDPELAHLTSGQKVWVQLQKGPDELHHLGKVTMQKPVSGDYLLMTLRLPRGRSSAPADSDSRLSVDWPVDRFFVNERSAPQADNWLREKTRGGGTIVAELRVLNGTAVLTDIAVDGRSFREVLKQPAQ